MLIVVWLLTGLGTARDRGLPGITLHQIYEGKEQSLILTFVLTVKVCIARILLGFYYDFLGFCQDLPMSFLGPPWDLLGPPGDLLGLARTS